MDKWEALLRKYIRHVRIEEGIDFISNGIIDFNDEMSEEEKQQLRQLSHEVTNA